MKQETIIFIIILLSLVPFYALLIKPYATKLFNELGAKDNE